MNHCQLAGTFLLTPWYIAADLLVDPLLIHC
jgi:hypothetical protein